MSIKLAGSYVLFSGLYLTQLTKISPVYIVSVILISLALLTTLYRAKLPKDKLLLVSLFGSLILLYQFILSDFSRGANFIISFLSPIVIGILYRREVYNFGFYRFYSLVYSLIFLTDGIYRVLNPDLTNLDRLRELGIAFHVYKFNSLMYSDSNFVGLQAVLVLSVFLWGVRKFEVKFDSVTIFIAALLAVSIFLSFSRAAYIGALLAVLLFYFRGGFWTYFVGVMVASVGAVAFFRLLLVDITFSQKFQILELMVEAISNGSIESMIFGVGIGNADHIIGKGTHNLFLTLLFEGGVLSLVLFVIILLLFYRKIGRDFHLLILPYILVAMSAGTLAMPYLFSVLSLVYLSAGYFDEKASCKYIDYTRCKGVI